MKTAGGEFLWLEKNGRNQPVGIHPGILAEVSGGDVKLLSETAGKGGGVVEAAGEGDLGDGVAGGAEHLNGHAKPAAESWSSGLWKKVSQSFFI